ncbi:MAG: immunoglobulin domain-containing protein [Verrucomicrobia bacterium]|nr:immunoglobulin domain-containing protein [Verrucomicrobiota bacterium]
MKPGFYRRTFGVLVLTCLALPAVQHAADVRFCVIGKDQGWKQTGPSTIARSDGDQYVFQAYVVPTTPGAVISAGIVFPDGQVHALNLESGTWLWFPYMKGTTDPNFPDGNFTFRISTLNDGARVVALPLAGELYPAAPQVVNFDAAQNINATADFTLNWFPFQGGTHLDTITLTIKSTSVPSTNVFVTTTPGTPGALDGTSTSVLIPANTFEAGTTYSAYIFFGKITAQNTTAYPGAVGYAGYGATTYFPIQTVGSLQAPVVTAQPQSQIVTVGTTVTFNVAVTGSVPLSYQWLKGGIPIPVGTNESFTVSNAQAADAGNYAVLVSNMAGSVTSATAVLTVNPVVVSPVIAVQPQGQTVNVGALVTFSVSATGTAPLAYQWQKNGTNIVGASNASYTIPSAQPGDAGNYVVVVSNASGSVDSQRAVLTVVAVNPARLSLSLVVGLPALTIDGLVGTGYRVEFSTNLAATNWTKVIDLSLPSTPYTYIDSTTGNGTLRFYRVVVP